MCRFAGPDQDHSRTPRVSGSIGRGLSGELRATSTPGPAGEPKPGALAFEVEVIMRRSFVRVVDRELPIPVAQLRRKKLAAAAMLLEGAGAGLARSGVGGPERELAVVAMAALRLLPIGPSGSRASQRSYGSCPGLGGPGRACDRPVCYGGRAVLRPVWTLACFALVAFGCSCGFFCPPTPRRAM